MKLTEDERNVLIFVRSYGGGIDFGGRGADRNRVRAVKALLERGLLSGDHRAAWMTPKGERALARQ